MGNTNSIKSTKKTNLFCCLCPSTYSINEKSLPTFDRLSLNSERNSKQINDHLEISLDFLINSNRDLSHLITKYHLKFYLYDYLNRLKSSKN